MNKNPLNSSAVNAKSEELSPLAKTLLCECNAMADYSLSSGDSISPELLETLHTIHSKTDLTASDIGQLVAIHRMLSSIVAPATPGGILAIKKHVQAKIGLHFLGPIPIVRHLTVTTIAFLFILIGTSLSNEVNYNSINHGLLWSSGSTLVLNMLFLLSCAGLGGCFSLLYKLNQFVIEASYDSKYDSTYWVRLLLGIVSGLFIVELLPQDLFVSSGDSSLTITQFGKPALAMLGGFSATMVYRILQRLVDTIESFIKGDPKSVKGAENRVRKMQFEQHKQTVNMQQAQSLNEIIGKLDSNDLDGAKELAKKAMQSTFPAQAASSFKTDNSTSST